MTTRNISAALLRTDYSKDAEIGVQVGFDRSPGAEVPHSPQRRGTTGVA